MYVVLNKGKIRVPYGESLGTADCVALYPRCRINRGRYNGFRLYLSVVLA
jgi:hypothetical protein